MPSRAFAGGMDRKAEELTPMLTWETWTNMTTADM
jgi:hypothetical protein